MDVLDSGDLDSSVQASLLEAELQSTGATRSAVELSLDEDKVCGMPCVLHVELCNHLFHGALTGTACRA